MHFEKKKIQEFILSKRVSRFHGRKHDNQRVNGSIKCPLQIIRWNENIVMWGIFVTGYAGTCIETEMSCWNFRLCMQRRLTKFCQNDKFIHSQWRIFRHPDDKFRSLPGSADSIYNRQLIMGARDISRCFSRFVGISLRMGSTNERRRYILTLSLIAWAYTQNDHWMSLLAMLLWHMPNFKAIQIFQLRHGLETSRDHDKAPGMISNRSMAL